jgi:hypothetical protein
MNRLEILHEAGKLISGKRHESYGDAKDNFTNIGRLWSIWLEMRFGVSFDITPEDVAMMLDDLKKARLGHDIKIGYSALGAEIALGE